MSVIMRKLHVGIILNGATWKQIELFSYDSLYTVYSNIWLPFHIFSPWHSVLLPPGLNFAKCFHPFQFPWKSEMVIVVLWMRSMVHIRYRQFLDTSTKDHFATASPPRVNTIFLAVLVPYGHWYMVRGRLTIADLFPDILSQVLSYILRQTDLNLK